MKRRRALRILVPAALFVIAATLRLVWLGDTPLIGDESYYWLMSRRLDWSCTDHPSGVALLIWLSTTLVGIHEVGIRWLNALLGIISVLLTYWVGEQMLSRRAAVFAAAILAIGAPYILTSRFVYTDALQLFLMLLNIGLFWRLLQERPSPRLGSAIGFGFSLALLLNIKYSAYFYTLALLVAVLIGHRRLLKDRRFWLGISIGLIGLLPVFVWNAAHDWVSFRWQLSHSTVDLSGRYDPIGNFHHALVYMSWPLALCALAGLGRMRNKAQWLLTLIALFMLVPVLFSGANSPRNLSNGLVPLLLLAGTRWPSEPAGLRRKATALVLGAAIFATALYGIGTLVSLAGPTAWPQSSAVRGIRYDASGWRELGPVLAAYPQPIFAVDYDIASRIRYYGEVPAYTAWTQFVLWGIPEFSDATIVALKYLDEGLLSAQLKAAFQTVDGPYSTVANERGESKEVLVWRAKGLLLSHQQFLQQFDFLTLFAEGR